MRRSKTADLASVQMPRKGVAAPSVGIAQRDTPIDPPPKAAGDRSGEDIAMTLRLSAAQYERLMARKVRIRGRAGSLQNQISTMIDWYFSTNTE